MNIVYVVLHYLVTQDTIECVGSILNNVQSIYNSWIIIVDNGSPNKSYVELEKTFVKYPTVKLIKSDKNLGFARGNNLGFRYAKNVLKADFIILINNDTLVEQIEFENRFIELYKKYNYSVLGPDIITSNGMHQSPIPFTNVTVKKLKICRIKQKLKYILVLFHLDRIIKSVKKSVLLVDRNSRVDQDIVGTPIHGACLIFSKNYIDLFDGLCADTFLYMEEEILWFSMQRQGLLSVYSPSIKIFHKEDVSTKAAGESAHDKELDKIRYWLDSSYVLERLMKESIINND